VKGCDALWCSRSVSMVLRILQPPSWEQTSGFDWRQ